MENKDKFKRMQVVAWEYAKLNKEIKTCLDEFNKIKDEQGLSTDLATGEDVEMFLGLIREQGISIGNQGEKNSDYLGFATVLKIMRDQELAARQGNK